MPMIGSALSILAGGPAKLRHRRQSHVLSVRPHILPEGCNRLRELLETICQLPIYVALVRMRAPAADVREGRLNPKIGLHQLSHLLQTVAKWSLRILHPCCRLVLRGICRLQHLHSLERLLPGPMQETFEAVKMLKAA